jgi:hypothetical protein
LNSRLATKYIPAVVALVALIVACSNRVSISGDSSYANAKFKPFLDSTGTSLTLRQELGKKIADELKSSVQLMSFVDEQSVMVAGKDGKSVVINTQDLQATTQTASISDTSEKPVWMYTMGEEQYWGITKEKIYYRARAGSEIAKIEENITSILDQKSTALTVISVSKTDLVGIFKDRILWLNAEPQLKREFYLKLDSVSLANFDSSKITGAGVIRGRGVWLVVGDYIVYILRDSGGQFAAENKRFKGFKAGKTTIVPSRVSMTLSANADGVISPVGRVFVLSGSKIYSTDEKAEVADNETSPKPIATEVATETPENAGSPKTPSAEELTQQYNNKFKALIDARCQPCHASAPRTPFGSFQQVKTSAGGGRSRVESNTMPPPNNGRGLSLSATERKELNQFLSDMEFLP